MTLHKIALAALLAAIAVPSLAATPEEEAATRAFNDHKFQEAADSLSRITQAYAARYRDTDKQRFYCASSTAESLLYAMLGAKDHVGATVLGPDWCRDLFMQAYAFTELPQPAKAEAALREAVRLAPMNAQFVNELAYVLAHSGRLDEALGFYRTAEDVSGMAPSDVSSRLKAASLRGQGWIMAEKRDWDAAEKLYRRSLELDPGNAIATSELQYVARNRGH